MLAARPASNHLGARASENFALWTEELSNMLLRGAVVIVLAAAVSSSAMNRAATRLPKRALGNHCPNVTCVDYGTDQAWCCPAANTCLGFGACCAGNSCYTNPNDPSGGKTCCTTDMGNYTITNVCCGLPATCCPGPMKCCFNYVTQQQECRADCTSSEKALGN